MNEKEKLIDNYLSSIREANKQHGILRRTKIYSKKRAEVERRVKSADSTLEQAREKLRNEK